MFATQTDRKTKLPTERKLQQADPSSDGAAATEQNGVWQSLALHPAAIQAKLAISQPNDPYEQEADRVAERVMRMAAPRADDSELSFSSDASLEAQRKCDPCNEEAEEKQLQRKEQGGHAESSLSAPAIVQQTLQAPGQPLDAATRAFMEPRFGRDFSRVRVQADAPAAESARTVNALAYTVGSRIVFGAGQYRPQTTEGQQLLAHELTHVVQQGRDSFHSNAGTGSGNSQIQRKIIVGGKEYTPTATYLKWLETNYGKAMVEFINRMHNGGKAPEYKFSSFEEMGNEVRMRSFIIQGIGEVHKGCCGYPTSGGDGQLDPAFWDKLGFFQFRVKPKLPAGKEASDAIEAIFKNGAGTELECNSTTVAIQYRAMLKTLGKAAFNKKFPGGAGVIISPHHVPPAGVAVHPIWDKKLYKQVTITGAGDLLPGDWVYFKNIADYSAKQPGGFWSGEHCLYLGGGKFRGFGIKEMDEGAINAELLKEYNKGLSVPNQKSLKDVPGLQNYARRPIIQEILK